MRLLYLTRGYTRHDARWLRVLAEHGVTAAFLSLGPSDETGFALTHPHTQFLATPGLPADATTPVLESALPAVRAQISAWAPDVIMAGPLTDAGYLAVRIAPEKTLLMSWAFDVLHEPKALPDAAERLRETLRNGHHLFTDCESLAHECEAIAGRRYASRCVLPWGLAAEDTPSPVRGLRRRLGDESAKVILYTRGFAEVHQPLTVIAGFRRAHALDGSLRLWLAGEGALRAQAEAAVAHAGLTAVTRFLGQLDQPALAGAMVEADAYVACSLSDGTSLSLLQAMHAGLPCIAADLPGNREWLRGAGGWLVPVHDAGALAAAIIAALALPAGTRERVATTNRQRVRERADLSTNLPRLLVTLRLIADTVMPTDSAPLCPEPAACASHS